MLKINPSQNHATPLRFFSLARNPQKLAMIIERITATPNTTISPPMINLKPTHASPASVSGASAPVCQVQMKGPIHSRS
jgi:hypothetical protein